MTVELMLWIAGSLFVIGAAIAAIDYKLLIATPIFMTGTIMIVAGLIIFISTGIYYVVESSAKRTYKEFQSQCEDVSGQVVGTNIYNLNCVEREVGDD